MELEFIWRCLHELWCYALSSEEQMLIFRFLRVSPAIALVFWAAGRSSAQDASILGPDPRPLLPLLQVLDRANLSGSLQISGVCESERFPKFPQVGEKKGDSTLTTLGEMLASNRGLSLTSDSNGVIRIIGPDVPTDFLNVRISHITFEGIDGPNFAMVPLLETPEVISFFKSKDIPLPMLLFINAAPAYPWNDPGPYISGTLDNVTVKEVLDRILQTFPGVWFYGNCVQDEKHKRAVFLHFYRLNKNRNRVSAGR